MDGTHILLSNCCQPLQTRSRMGVAVEVGVGVAASVCLRGVRAVFDEG